MLFLDEMPEFGATKLEGLRQPLEDRTVTLARAAGTLSFPANFTLDRGDEPVSLRVLRRPAPRLHLRPGSHRPLSEAVVNWDPTGR